MQDAAFQETLEALERMPAWLAECARRFRTEEVRTRAPDGSFSLVEHACHLADLEREAYQVRIGRIRAEQNPQLADFDGAAAAEAGRYHERALAQSLAAFAAARARSLETLRAVGAHEWSRPAAQEGVGALTLKDIPRLMAEHDASHRAELEALRAGILSHALAATPAKLRAAIGEFSDAALRRPPLFPPKDAEALSAIGHACHLRDIEIDGYHVRLRRTRTETNPSLPSLDSDRLAAERQYDTSDAGAALEAFERARATTLADLRSVLLGEWARPADFEGYGAVTLLGLLEILRGHDAVHLAALAGLARN